MGVEDEPLHAGGLDLVGPALNCFAVEGGGVTAYCTSRETGRAGAALYGRLETVATRCFVFGVHLLH